MSFSSKIEYEELLDRVPDGLLLIDESGVISDANSKITDLFGYDLAELKDEPIELLVPEPYREDHSSHRREYMANPSRRAMGSGLQLGGRRKDGSVFPVDVSLSPAEGNGQKWVIASVRDVSDRVERQQRLSVLTRILRHDIRNRLTLIIGYAEMCKDSLEDLDVKLETATQPATEDPTISTLVEDIQEHSEDINDLLRELDNFTDSKLGVVEKIIQAATELDSLAERANQIDQILGNEGQKAEPVRLNSFLESSVATIQATHPKATVHTDFGEEITLYQPKDMVRICVEELLNNALKHTDSPEPWVSIETSILGESEVEITVTDEGPGLPEQERNLLSMKAETPLMHSTGFGLWEVNWIVSKMEGEFWFEENQPRGTIAKIRVPIKPTENV